MLNKLLHWLFPPEPPQSIVAPKYMSGLLETAIRRGKEVMPCCGGMRRAHVKFRSGETKCPEKMTADEYLQKVKHLQYNPLEVDEEFEPPWSEPHFLCESCGCARGVHTHKEPKLGRRGAVCTDPDCPGCPNGCV